MNIKGKWKVFTQILGGEQKYIAGRILDTSKVLHGGNIEYSGGYSINKKEVLGLCDRLNLEERL